MHSDTKPALFSGQLLAARIISALVVLFLLFDGIIHLIKPTPVVDAFARLGYPLKASIGIGVVEVVCLLAYIVPRTAPLGAILLTGLMGGAIATHVRAGSPIFETYLFPILLGLLIWCGIWLRDDRLRSLVPVRIAD